MRFLRNNGLTLALMLLFLLSVGGQLVTGFHAYNDELTHEMQPRLDTLAQYAGSAHFRSTIFENWESEFLQMGIYVLLTMFLYQKGSSESKPPPDEKQEPRKYTHIRYFKHHPLARKFYKHSLCTALFMLFAISILLHAQGSRDLINEENLHMGKPLISFWGTFKEYEFWFESFQNWQSEFFSVAVLITLSIFLRQEDSPQSKETDAPHRKTGH
jgi:hypothetical protein